MSTQKSTQPAVPFLLRHSVELLTLATVAFILQTGFIPFDFTLEGVAPDLRSFLFGATKEANLPDIVANIFLYVPFGVFFHWTLIRRRHLHLSALALSVVAAVLLSGTIEWCQAFSPSRVSSLPDVVCNAAGTAIGAALSWIAQRTIPGLVGAILFELRSNPRGTLVKLYCLLLACFATLPFSFSFSASQLKKSAKSAVLVPFAAVVETGNKLDDTIERTDVYALSMARWKILKQWSRWAAECASFCVLIWLLTPLLRDDYGFSRRATLGLTLWLAGFFAVGLSILQFPVVSRGLDVTDILFRLLGVATGLVTHAWYVCGGSIRNRIPQKLRLRRLTGIACAGSVAYIIYTGVLPLVFEYSDGRLEKALASPAFRPFMGYFVTRFDVMFTDVAEKCSAYAVFAALLATSWTRIADRPLAGKINALLPVGLVLCILIECVQVFLPVRVPSLTDPILAGLGCVVGVMAQVYATDCWRFAQTHEMLGPHHRIKVSNPYRGDSLADQLLGSLSDPDERAPHEPSPAQTPTHPKE